MTNKPNTLSRHEVAKVAAKARWLSHAPRAISLKDFTEAERLEIKAFVQKIEERRAA